MDVPFLVPLIGGAGPRPSGSARLRQWRRHRRRCQDINGAITSLNWCAGRATPSATGPSQPTFRQGMVHARVGKLVDQIRPKDAIPCRRASFLEMLRGRCAYDCDGGGLSLVSFRSVAHISLPDSTQGSPSVESVVDAGARQFLEDNMVRMLRGTDEIDELKSTCGITPHVDRVLASSRRRYGQLVRALISRGMVVLMLPSEVSEDAGVFLVEKKGKNQHRLIIDARLSNLHFHSPPGVELLTAEGLSRLEVTVDTDLRDDDDQIGLTLGTADI